MLPGMYLGMIVLTAILASAASLGASLIVFIFVIHVGLWPWITLAIVVAAGGMSSISVPMITLNRITAKKVKIEFKLPFLLAYMATLSSAGMNPVETIKHVAMKDFGPISKEFQKVVYREEILGEDIITALNYVASNTPSTELRDILTGMTNIIVSGGSLQSYCEQESKSVFEKKKTKLKGFIDSLAAFSEGYIGGIIISIVMAIIGIIIVGALGFKIGPLSTQQLLDVFVFLVIPLVNMLFIAGLEMKFSGGEY
jgi:flagellar protein FlaJ